MASLSMKDFAEKLLVDAGVADIEVANLSSVVWFRGPWCKPEEPVTTVRHGDPCPFNPAVSVFAMYQDDEEFRIYAVPNAPPAPSQGPPPPTRMARYRLSKKACVYGCESMTVGTFAEEMIEELQAAAGINQEDDGPDEIECPACGVDVPHLVHCGACGAALPIEEDDDEATKPGAGEVPAPANGAAPTAPASGTTISPS
jgi:hypothetical protein